MNDVRLDPILEQWLSDGPASGPKQGLDRALAATQNVAQPPGWTFRRWWVPTSVADAQAPRGLQLAIVLVLTLALVVALAVAFGGQFRRGPLVLSPTDEVVAFSEGGEIYVARPDGSDRRSLNAGVANAVAPVFSPDGAHLAFVARTSPATGSGRLLIASVDGSAPTLVEINRDLQVVLGDIPNVSWSSDSNRIAFAALSGANAQIFVVNRDGTGLTAITDGSARSDLPSWSPIAEFGLITGEWIAYRVSRPDQGQVGFERVRPDGTGREVITAVIGPGASLSKLTWSPYDPAQPDHRYVTMSYAMNAGFGTETRAVIDGGVGHQLDIWSEGLGGFPDAPIPWSPDSRYVAFISAEGSVLVGDDDRTSDSYEGQLRDLGPILDCWVAWSPDSQLLYGGAPNGCAGVVVVSVQNPMAAARLANEPGVASWRPVP